MPTTASNLSQIKVLDLFCGGGGLSEGFIQAGYDVIAGVDKGSDFLDTFQENHSDSLAICEDLSEVAPKEFFHKHSVNPDDIDVVIGGPPCKGFSIAGHRDPEDERNYLVGNFIDFVDYVQPDAFVMENVPGIKSMENGDTLQSIIEGFAQAGYHKTSYKTLNAADYGVPQKRRRVIFLGEKGGQKPSYPERTHSPSQQSTLTGDQLNPYVSVEEAILNKDVEGLPNHTKTNHSEEMVQRISEVEEGESLYESYGDSWRRLERDKPAITIKENHNAPFIHPDEDRVGTVRECAILQSFPDDYIFKGAKSTQLKVVGNAVPPGLANAIAQSLLADLHVMKQQSIIK